MLAEFNPLLNNGCQCSVCASAREKTAAIEKELTKFSTDEILDIHTLIRQYEHKPGQPQSRDEERICETLNKVLQAIS